MKSQRAFVYLKNPLVLIAALEAIQMTFNKPTIARATAPPKPTSISLAAPVAAEPDPVFVAPPEPVIVVATPVPVGVMKDVVLNVPVLVQEQLVSKKAEV